jgi:hypothetical protein
MAIAHKIVSSRLQYPPCIPPQACKLLDGLLDRCPQARLPCARGAPALKAHPFFSGVDWDAVATQTGLAPASFLQMLEAFSGLHLEPMPDEAGQEVPSWVECF